MIGESRRSQNKYPRKRPIDDLLGPQENFKVRTPSQSFSPVDKVLGGKGGGGKEGNRGDPWGGTVTSFRPGPDPYMDVYKTAKAGAMTNLEEMQMKMAESFAHKGGYFGGTHAIAQGEMAAETGAYLDQLLAETSLEASKRKEADWLRAREETMSLANLIPTLLNTELFQTIVQQPGQGKGGGLGTIAGGAAGSVLGPMGGAIGSGIGENIVGGK